MKQQTITSSVPAANSALLLLYSGWLSDEIDPLGYVQRINNRLEDATGLTMTTAEDLQVSHFVVCCHCASKVY